MTSKDYKSYAKITAVGSLAVGIAIGLISRVKVCRPNEFLVRTGLGIKDMSVSKKGIQFPFQKAIFIEMNPKTYTFDLHNMSKEKVEFKLPVVFTIGPKNPIKELDLFENYARNIFNLSEAELENTVKGVIEGETRALTASLTIEEMFNGKEKFKELVINKIQTDLNKLGLDIYNANIKEMNDYDKDNKYFEYRKKRAIESANFEAQVDVSEARKLGELGVKERERDTKIAISTMDMESTLVENERRQAIAKSNAALAEVDAQTNLKSEIARIHSLNEAKRLNEELLEKVERQRAQRELEKSKADTLVQVKVNSEAAIEQARGQAESIKLIANANLYKQEQEAKGLEANLLAHAKGLETLLTSAQNNADFAKFYLGVEKNLFQDIAKQQAIALQNLNPKISIWNTDQTTDPFKFFTKGFQNMLPLIDGLKNNTNLLDNVLKEPGK